MSTALFQQKKVLIQVVDEEAELRFRIIGNILEEELIKKVHDTISEVLRKDERVQVWKNKIVISDISIGRTNKLFEAVICCLERKFNNIQVKRGNRLDFPC